MHSIATIRSFRTQSCATASASWLSEYGHRIPGLRPRHTPEFQLRNAGLGGAATGANPTDRGKKGTKRSLRTDGRGIPLAIVAAGANRHDKMLLAATLDAVIVPRPEPTEEARQHLSLDRGYDYDMSREEAASRGYEVHIPQPRGQERRQPYAEGSKPRRWVVERTHSWLNRSRRLLVRWEKKSENYLAFLHLACAQLIFGKLARLSGSRTEQPI